MTEGYIKYSCSRIPRDPPAETIIHDMNVLRTGLFDLGLIGMNEDGIGFGNISIRNGSNDTFYVTATRTGGIRTLSCDGYSLVMDFDIRENTLICGGRKKASSEAMSHGALYRNFSTIQCVVHIHNAFLWKMMISSGYPATDPHAEFGTPAMADSLVDVFSRIKGNAGAVVMKGHRDGIIVAGGNVDEAKKIVFQLAGKGIHDVDG